MRIFLGTGRYIVIKKKVQKRNNKCKLKNAKEYTNESKNKKWQNKPSVRPGISKKAAIDFHGQNFQLNRPVNV